MSRPALYVRLLGEPDVESSEGRHALLSDKRYLLLAFLACQRDWVDRGRLARLFWPDHDPPAARHNLRQLIKRLNTLDWGPVIETGTGRDGARLRWLPATDLADLDAALADGRWAEARALHRGRLLEGLRPDAAAGFDDWLERHRQALEDRVRSAFMTGGAALVAAGGHAEAAELYAHLIAAEPFDEAALGAYMEASAAAGQPSKALSAFQRFATRLSVEFDLSPATATESLARRIRTGESPAARPAGGGEPPERGGSDTAGVRPPWLVGRDLELSDVHRLMADPECRLLTITGPGGVGKSALARRAAHELGGAYSDGCVLVQLDQSGSATGLLAAIAAHPSLAPAKGVASDPAPVIGERRLLLVLDDLDEYRLEAERLPGLLDACPDLSIIATTRERLSVRGEWLLPLDGLPEPSMDATTAEVLANDAVRLFVAHAERVRPAFYLSEADASHVATVCRLVAGLPLALELAAAWTRALPLAAIADEIAGGLDLLVGGPRGAADRHTSMRACIERSWRSLSDGERRGWRALAVFDSPFDRVAAARVADVPLPLLRTLVDKSLLRSTAAGLFSFHPLLRAFAFERLQEEAAVLAELRERHAHHFLALVDGIGGVLGPERRAAVSDLGTRLDDAAAAWRWAVAAAAGRIEARQPPPPEALLRWCQTLSAVCEERAWFSLAADLFRTAGAELTGSAATPELVGTLAAQRGWHELRLGRAGEADDAARHAIDLLADHSAAPAYRTALQTRAGVAMQRGEYVLAHELFERALASARGARARAGAKVRREIAKLTGNLGIAKQLLGDRRGAATQFRRQLDLLREVGDAADTVPALSNLGNVLRLLDRGEEAQATLDECLRVATEAGDDSVMPSLNVNLAVLHMQLGAPERARRHLLTAATQARDQGRQALVVTVEYQLGRLELQCGELDAAGARFDTALDMAVRTVSLTAVLDALAGLAWVGWRAGSATTARNLARAVQRHQATSPGTRSWVGELVALTQEAPGGGDGSAGGDEVVGVTGPYREGVTKALALVAGSVRA